MKRLLHLILLLLIFAGSAFAQQKDESRAAPKLTASPGATNRSWPNTTPTSGHTAWICLRSPTGSGHHRGAATPARALEAMLFTGEGGSDEREEIDHP